MKIVYARNLYRPADFGGNRYPVEVTQRLATRGHDVRVITATFPGPSPVRNVHLIRYPVSRRTPFETFFTNALFGGIAVSRAVRSWRPDVIAVSSYDVAYGYHWFRAGDATPIVYIYHSRFHSDSVDRVARRRWPLSAFHAVLRRFVRSVERTTFLSASTIVAVSSFSRTEILERAPETIDRIRVIPTGVDTEVFVPGDREVARERLGIPRDALVLIGVGRMVPVKRYDRVVDAVALLRGRVARPLVLMLVGQGPEVPLLRARADALGIADVLRLDGYCDGNALHERLVAADVQVCTSEFENWSIALLEGLACGLPVVGTPRGGTPDLLRQVDPRLILPSTEPADLARVVEELAGDPSSSADISARARAVAMQYGWERTVDRLEGALAAVDPARP